MTLSWMICDGGDMKARGKRQEEPEVASTHARNGQAALAHNTHNDQEDSQTLTS